MKFMIGWEATIWRIPIGRQLWCGPNLRFQQIYVTFSLAIDVLHLRTMIKKTIQWVVSWLTIARHILVNRECVFFISISVWLFASQAISALQQMLIFNSFTSGNKHEIISKPIFFLFWCSNSHWQEVIFLIS